MINSAYLFSAQDIDNKNKQILISNSVKCIFSSLETFFNFVRLNLC